MQEASLLSFDEVKFSPVFIFLGGKALCEANQVWMARMTEVESYKVIKPGQRLVCD
jgi:hypothetical protein